MRHPCIHFSPPVVWDPRAPQAKCLKFHRFVLPQIDIWIKNHLNHFLAHGSSIRYGWYFRNLESSDHRKRCGKQKSGAVNSGRNFQLLSSTSGDSSDLSGKIIATSARGRFSKGIPHPSISFNLGLGIIVICPYQHSRCVGLLGLRSSKPTHSDSFSVVQVFFGPPFSWYCTGGGTYMNLSKSKVWWLENRSIFSYDGFKNRSIFPKMGSIKCRHLRSKVIMNLVG